jgi:hypothetical protein
LISADGALISMIAAKWPVVPRRRTVKSITPHPAELMRLRP